MISSMINPDQLQRGLEQCGALGARRLVSVLPAFARFNGLTEVHAADRLLKEHELLRHIKIINHHELVEAGLEDKLVEKLKTSPLLPPKGRMIVVEDHPTDRGFSMPENTRPSIKPYAPLGVSPDQIDYFDMSGDLAVGRPNAEGELVLFNGCTVEQYDVVVACVNRLLQKKREGLLPDLNNMLINITLNVRPDGGGLHTMPFYPTEYTSIAKTPLVEL